VLDQHVLKSTSSCDQRDVPLARLPYNLMCRLGIAVWTSGSDNKGRTRGGDPGGVTNRVGGHDPDIDEDPSIVSCMSEGCEGRAVVQVICRQIYQHRDDNGAHR
jgi:hypothetical protein